MAGSESLFENPRYVSIQIQDALAEQKKTDANYRDDVCQEMWQQLPSDERGAMQQAFGRESRGGSVVAKGEYLKTALLTKLVRQIVAGMEENEAKSQAETTPEYAGLGLPETSIQINLN